MLWTYFRPDQKIGDWAFAKIAKYDGDDFYRVLQHDPSTFIYKDSKLQFETFSAADAFIRLVCQ